jgi:hypothetical protein
LTQAALIKQLNSMGEVNAGLRAELDKLHKVAPNAKPSLVISASGTGTAVDPKPVVGQPGQSPQSLQSRCLVQTGSQLKLTLDATVVDDPSGARALVGVVSAGTLDGIILQVPLTSDNTKVYGLALPEPPTLGLTVLGGLSLNGPVLGALVHKYGFGLWGSDVFGTAGAVVPVWDLKSTAVLGGITLTW